MWWQACLWGALGAGLVEAGEMWHLYRAQDRFPWVKDERPQVKPYIFALSLRFFMAIGITAVYGVSGQVAGPLVAVTLGIAAPIIIQQFAGSSSPEQPSIGLNGTAADPPRHIADPNPDHTEADPCAQQPPPPADPGRPQ